MHFVGWICPQTQNLTWFHFIGTPKMAHGPASQRNVTSVTMCTKFSYQQKPFHKGIDLYCQWPTEDDDKELPAYRKPALADLASRRLEVSIPRHDVES
jgi:hypothetical protein